MPEIAQQPMECITTSVTMSSMPPTKATFGKSTHQVNTIYTIISFQFSYCYSSAPVPLIASDPSVAPCSSSPLSISHYPDLTLCPICQCALCLLTSYMTLSAACLFIRQHFSTNHCLAGKAADLANKQSFVRPLCRPHTCSAKS